MGFQAHSGVQAGCPGQGPRPGQSKTPAQIDGQEVRIQQDCRQGSAKRRTDPPGTIDRQIRPAAHTCRDKLVNSGIDGRILTTDTRTRQEAAGRKPDKVKGEGGRNGGNQIDDPA